MNKVQNAVEQIMSGIMRYVDKKIENITCDKTVFGVIISENTANNTYKIKIKNVEYDNVQTIGGSCSVNEVVRVLIPMNNYNNMVILKA